MQEFIAQIDEPAPAKWQIFRSLRCGASVFFPCRIQKGKKRGVLPAEISLLRKSEKDVPPVTAQCLQQKRVALRVCSVKTEQVFRFRELDNGHDALDFLEHQRGVSAPKAKRIGQRHVNLHVTGSARHIVQIALRVLLENVDGRRSSLVVNTQR